ncbi:MAG: helix-turn-helix transcriptional regulator [Clostridia bacterium]|nr:helix-turn-helix transcriptional regulator [Clostridia bacterium]
MDKQNFSKRLAELRVNKGVSARDMSLSIGKNASYINDIENCKSFPSINVFFNICEYLGVTPMEFFDTQTKNPVKSKELLDAAKSLSDEQLDAFINIAKDLR